MKRVYKKPRVKKVKPPRPVPPPKPERPRRGELKKIYKDLISTNEEQRINALATAMGWYDRVQAYLAFNNKGKWTLKQLRAKNKAETNRAKGIASKNFKEGYFLEAITHYQNMVRSYNVPRISVFLRKLKSSKGSMHEHLSSMKRKYKKFLTMLQDAMVPVNNGKEIKFTVDKLASPYRIGRNEIILDRKLMAHLKKITHRYGLLSAVIELLPVTSEAMSRFEVVDTKGHKAGKFSIDYGDRYRAVLQLINHVNTYAQEETAPKSIVRRRKPKKEN